MHPEGLPGLAALGTQRQADPLDQICIALVQPNEKRPRELANRDLSHPLSVVKHSNPAAHDINRLVLPNNKYEHFKATEDDLS